MKFVIATGGTGGHLFPAIRVAKELKCHGHDILFLGSFRRGLKQITASGFPFKELGAKGFADVSLKQKAGSVMAMTGAVYKAICFLKAFKPDGVAGFGGYGSFPVGIAAVLLRYPLLIHEQNVVPGQANRILAWFARKVAISFRRSGQYFNTQKTVLTGCPCTFPAEVLDRAAVLEKFRLKEGRTTILVFGGSQGSQRINKIFLEAAENLKGTLDFQVIHLSGAQGYQDLQVRYNQLGIPFALFEFFDKMEEAYHISDLVISRAGAVTVSEIACFGLPAIFVPYPHAHGHQKENADVLCDEGVAEVIEDKDLSASKLAETVLKAVNGRTINKRFKEICFFDAAERLAREILCLKK